MSSFTQSSSFNRRTLTSLAIESLTSPIGSALASPRTQNFGGSPRPATNRLKEISYRFQVLIIAGTILTFLVIIAGSFLYVVPSLGPAYLGYNGALQFSISATDDKECDILDGTWVVDDDYPLYNASECPFVEKGFNCLGNGRGHEEYLKWRWKPKQCTVPRFEMRIVLERLRGKRVAFVGDSMSRTQWESLICMLMTGLEDKRSVYEVNGNKISKRIRFLGVRFSTYDLTVEFYRSVFLVQPGRRRWHAPKRVKSTLKLDVLDGINREWRSADFLVFNTGQWWVPGKLFET